MTSKRTSIEWTSGNDGEGRSWQVTRGCSRESPGCQECYAEGIAARFSGPSKPFEQVIHPRHKKWSGVLLTLPESLAEPFSWRTPSKVFVNSMSDLFHPAVPDEYIAAVFAVMAANPRHTFQLLTKRAERMHAWFWVYMANQPWVNMHEGAKSYMGYDHLRRPVINEWIKWPLSNVWLGVSVEDQQRANERVPYLLRCPASVRWLSCEPLLGAVNLEVITNHNLIDWVVVGGESGRNARPMDLRWARDLVQQRQALGTPVFVKQLGRRPLCEGSDKLWPITDRKGAAMADWPWELRVRNFPA